MVIFALGTGFACDRREPAPSTPDSPRPTQPSSAAKPQNLLVFPIDLRVPDDSVNEFVERAMSACATGEYDSFRRLWSAQRDPLSRGEFEQGWQAVRSIRVRALQRVIIAQAEATDAQSRADADRPAEDAAVYVLLTDLSLDPQHAAGQAQPTREAALLIVREQDQWRLTRAPKQVREWVKAHVVGDSAPVAGGAREVAGGSRGRVGEPNATKGASPREPAGRREPSRP